jgi:hypothetical protein
MMANPSLGNCGHIRIFESVSLTRYVEYTQPCPWCEIERLRAECTRLLARGDKAELELNSLKAHYARRAPDEPSGGTVITFDALDGERGAAGHEITLHISGHGEHKMTLGDTLTLQIPPVKSSDGR